MSPVAFNASVYTPHQWLTYLVVCSDLSPHSVTLSCTATLAVLRIRPILLWPLLSLTYGHLYPRNDATFLLVFPGASFLFWYLELPPAGCPQCSVQLQLNCQQSILDSKFETLYLLHEAELEQMSEIFFSCLDLRNHLLKFAQVFHIHPVLMLYASEWTKLNSALYYYICVLLGFKFSFF